MKKKILNITSLIFVLLFMMSLTAAAQTDSAGNAFISDSDAMPQTIERDLYWAGSTRVFDGYQIGKGFLAAGRNITVNESTIGGSLRAAGYSITLNNVDVTDNITAAGYNLQASGVTAGGVYLAGQTLYFSGTADSVNLFGNNVTLDGEVNGDVNIFADKIVFGENLNIDGTLTVHSGSEPVLPNGAKAGDFVFVKSEAATKVDINVDAGGPHIELQGSQDTNAPAAKPEDAAAEPVKPKSSGFGSFLRGLAGNLLLAALLCLLLGGEQLGKPGKMLLQRPFPMLGSGFAGLFVIPGIILMLLFIGIGGPSAGLLAILFAVVCIYALIFTGMTLANTLLPRFIDNKWMKNEWICSLIGALVFWLLRKIPVLGSILQAAALLYTLGYFIQVIFLRLKGKRTRKTAGKQIAEPNPDPVEIVKPAVSEAAIDTASAGNQAENTEGDSAATEK
ncbi:MAG: hypothetical protein II969_04765 [Anaerolineaceae bacterium]|nr:hypothetical protein [Anaerolineaceae bacterium]